MAGTISNSFLAGLHNRQQRDWCGKLELNLRYQLAQLSRAWPDRLDARINRIVQCRTPQAREQVENRLKQEGLLSATVDPWHALHAWQIEIDGNVNSWGAAVEAAFRELHTSR